MGDATTTAMPGPMVPTRILPRSSMPAKPETVTGLMLVTALLMPTVTSLLVTATLLARALLSVLPMVPSLDLLPEITVTESLESRDTHLNPELFPLLVLPVKDLPLLITPSALVPLILLVFGISPRRTP